MAYLYVLANYWKKRSPKGYPVDWVITAMRLSVFRQIKGGWGFCSTQRRASARALGL